MSLKTRRKRSLQTKILRENFKLPPKHTDWVMLMELSEPQETLLAWRARAAEERTTLPAIIQREYHRWRSRKYGPPKTLRLGVRIPAELHRRIQHKCAKEGLDMAKEIRALLEERFPAMPDDQLASMDPLDTPDETGRV